MSRAILPSADEVPSLVPQPHSVLWRYGDDARLMAAAGYTLLLQVAHPAVGAAVKEHSNFRSQPWIRLLGTLDYVYTVTYGGPERAAAAGRHLREMHKRIKGVDPQGRRYHALDPEAYAWVHGTLYNAIVVAHERFGRPLRPDQQERLYREYLALGRIIGVRQGDLPEDLAGFHPYFDRMVNDVLEDNATIHDVLESLRRPVRPPVPMLGDRAWKAVRIPIARVLELATVGLLPPVLRDRCGLRFTALEERELRALAAASRATTPVLPKRLRHVGA
ncbi:MAG: hypothetical protein JWN32_731, partial [Solirubrobacterales bacterium]|nr:hypothetical protein [Solirubrobacterales bacterium]